MHSVNRKDQSPQPSDATNEITPCVRGSKRCLIQVRNLCKESCDERNACVYGSKRSFISCPRNKSLNISLSHSKHSPRARNSKATHRHVSPCRKYTPKMKKKKTRTCGFWKLCISTTSAIKLSFRRPMCSSDFLYERARPCRSDT